MLYNLTQHLLKRETVAAWAEQHPPFARFDTHCMDGTCFISRYLTDHGFPADPYDKLTEPLWDKLHTLYFRTIISGTHTFGAVAKRLRKLS